MEKDAGPTLIEDVRATLKEATKDRMATLFAKHPFVDENALLVYLIAAATLETGPEELARFAGISLEAAAEIEARLVASIVVPDLADQYVSA